MNKLTLSTLFSEALFRIPDYQRGYAWETSQWKDFIQDIDALVEENVISHYTGTVVVYDAGRQAENKTYGTKKLRVVDVVDGQQRLTTSCLYLSAILLTLIARGEKDYVGEIPSYLYAGLTCKLSLNNDCQDVFYDLLKLGRVNLVPQSIHGKRLVAARAYFQEHLEKQLEKRGDQGVDYLKDIFNAIVQKLGFTYYAIEEECEIGMTFEFMNSRGKDLSILEKLKNYLMHWVTRNGTDTNERAELSKLINNNWKTTYTNLGKCNGDEDQCLRVAWTLYCSYTPANWTGYAGFKDDGYMPLRNFTEKRSKAMVKEFLIRFSEGLAEVSSHYASIINPLDGNCLSPDEEIWLTKIHHSGNIANFLPLMVAARKHCQNKSITSTDYIELLKALECYAYRVFLFEGRRSNAGKTNFYRWGFEVFEQKQELSAISNSIYALVRYYADENEFNNWISKPADWYRHSRLLRYTLFEYELYLLKEEGKNKAPSLSWEQLSDSTLEHILPQNPDEGSRWNTVWSKQDFDDCLHDIGNLVLTQNNSNYRNFEFERKKGKPGISPSYSDSDIRQERRIALYADWTREKLNLRRDELIDWIGERWKTEGKGLNASPDVLDDADEEGN